MRTHIEEHEFNRQMMDDRILFSGTAIIITEAINVTLTEST